MAAPGDRDGHPPAGEHRRPHRAQRPLQLPAARAPHHRAGLRPDGPGDPRGGRLPGHRAGAPPRGARRLQRDRPGRGPALGGPARAGARARPAAPLPGPPGGEAALRRAPLQLPARGGGLHPVPLRGGRLALRARHRLDAPPFHPGDLAKRPGGAREGPPAPRPGPRPRPAARPGRGHRPVPHGPHAPRARSHQRRGLRRGADRRAPARRAAEGAHPGEPLPRGGRPALRRAGGRRHRRQHPRAGSGAPTSTSRATPRSVRGPRWAGRGPCRCSATGARGSSTGARWSSSRERSPRTCAATSRRASRWRPSLDVRVLPAGQEPLGAVAGIVVQKMPEGSLRRSRQVRRAHRRGGLPGRARERGLAGEALARAVVGDDLEVLSARGGLLPLQLRPGTGP